MVKERGGYLFDLFSAGGVGNTSKSLDRTSKDVDAIRMKALGHLGVNFDAVYYGDTLTWDELETVGTTWGKSIDLVYAELKAGWIYDYEANGKVFTVINDLGVAEKKVIKTWSELGICWDIMYSHQFKIHFSADFLNDAFLPAWRWKRGQEPVDPDDPNNQGKKESVIFFAGIKLAHIDPFFSDEALHFTCKRMINVLKTYPVLENDLTQTLEKAKEVHILRSLVPVRQARGDYSGFMIKAETSKSAKRDKKRNAVVEIVMADLIMIAYFSSLMNMSKPVYEPWMLFGMWKWLGSSDPILSIEKIFDLSPRW